LRKALVINLWLTSVFFVLLWPLTAPCADTSWLNHRIGYYILTDHPQGGGMDDLPKLSQTFKEHFFRIDPRKYGPHVRVQRFMTTDFLERLETYRKEHAVSNELRRDFRSLLALEGLPTNLGSEDLKDFKNNPGRTRYASVQRLALTGHPLRAYELPDHDMYFVNDVVRRLTYENLPELRKVPLFNERAVSNLRKTVRDLLSEDGDEAYCEDGLNRTGEVSVFQLRRRGFNVPPGEGEDVSDPA